MQLIGAFPSQLATFHKQELLTLLQQAIQAGDYGGGKLVDSTVLTALNQQALDFSSLPSIQADNLALVESALYPLSLLQARYSAIAQERTNFLNTMQVMLGVLQRDSNLVDQLIALTALQVWVSQQGSLGGAVQFALDFAASHGSVGQLPLTDPASGALFSSPVQDVGFMLNAVDGFEAEPLRFGIGLPAAPTMILPADMEWTYSSPGQVENLVGDKWAKLTILETAPRLTYGAPAVQVITPVGNPSQAVFSVMGSELQGNVPIYIRVFFSKRRRTLNVSTGISGQAVAFTPYQLVEDNFLVVDSTQSYDAGLDYQVDTFGRFVPTSTTANKTLTILFSEMFPCYQASFNQLDWGPVVMFDANRLNPDGSDILHAFSVSNGWFPILDDGGVPTGLFIQLSSIPSTEYLLQVTRSVSTNFGIPASLNIHFPNIGYMDGIHLEPYSNFPVRITSISAQGMQNQNSVLWSGDLVLDRPITIRFNRQLVQSLQFGLLQESYILNEHVVDPTDQLRRQALTAIQASVPFAAQRLHVTPSVTVSGAQYEFGFTNIRGEDWNPVLPQDRGVFVSGPYEVDGSPELIRLDASYSGTVNFYLLDAPYDGNGLLVGSTMLESSPAGAAMSPGVAFGYIPPSTAPVLSKVLFYVKAVLQDPLSVVERILLQVTTA